MREDDGRKLDHHTLEALRLRAVEQVARQAASKSSCRDLSCVNAAKDELRRGVNMAVLSAHRAVRSL